MDIPNGCRGTRQNHNRDRVASDNRSSGEQHIRLILLHGPFVLNLLCIFSHAFTFTRQDGLIDPERVALDG